MLKELSSLPAREVDFCHTTRHTPSVMSQKSRRSEASAKNESGEYATFENGLKQVLSVPRSKMRATLEAEKKRKKVSSRASGDRA